MKTRTKVSVSGLVKGAGSSNEQAAMPRTTPSGEKGDGLMFGSDESNESAFDTIMRRIDEARKRNEASFLKDPRRFRPALRVIGDDGEEVIDKFGRSRLPSPRVLGELLLREGKSVVFAVAARQRKGDRWSLVTLSYDGAAEEACYERRDLNRSGTTVVLEEADWCRLSYAMFRRIYETAAGFGMLLVPIFAQEAA